MTPAEADMDNVTQNVRRKIDETLASLTDVAEKVNATLASLTDFAGKLETTYTANDVDNVTIDELRRSYSNYENSLTSMTLTLGRSFGYDTTQDAEATMSFTADDDITQFGGIWHYLERLQEQRELFDAASSATTVSYASRTNSSSSDYGDASGQEAEPAPFESSIPEIQTVGSDDDDVDGNVLPHDLAADGVSGNMGTSSFRLRFATQQPITQHP